jgi:hypothetical protein
MGNVSICAVSSLSPVNRKEFRDNMGDMSFSGGFETMEAGKDKEGWIEVVGLSSAM